MEACKVVHINRHLMAGAATWFIDSLFRRTYYHKTINLYFKVVKDYSHAPSGYPRYADGVKIVCRRCGMPAASVCEYVEHMDAFFLVRVFCHLGCWAAWKLEGTEPAAPKLMKGL